METKKRKSSNFVKFLFGKKPDIDFKDFDRDLNVNPLVLSEENEIISLFNRIQEKLSIYGEVGYFLY